MPNKTKSNCRNPYTRNTIRDRSSELLSSAESNDNIYFCVEECIDAVSRPLWLIVKDQMDFKYIINMNGARGCSRHVTANKTSPPNGNRTKYVLSIVIRTVVRKCRGNFRSESIVIFLKKPMVFFFLRDIPFRIALRLPGRSVRRKWFRYSDHGDRSTPRIGIRKSTTLGRIKTRPGPADKTNGFLFPVRVYLITTVEFYI